jgi:glycerol-3-phosphate dehydrogenase
MTLGGAADTRASSGNSAPITRLAGEPWDVLVIGGGITGAGVAREAAMRGLRTALVEARDLGWGTSSRSSRLVHGGLRYLEQGQLGLVHESLRERRVLLGIAPHLVRPQAFVFPVHRNGRVPLWKLAAGMWLYDALALFRNVRAHRMLGKRGLLRREPMLRERDLAGGAVYWDAQCDDARLVVATARAAGAHGAAVATYTEVTGFVRAGRRISGVELRDQFTGETGTALAHVVINATGPWADRLRKLENPAVVPLLRPTKGAHVLLERGRIGHHDAITFTSPIDGRVMFVLPWDDQLSYVGTTDTDTEESPADTIASGDDVVYLLRSVNALFPNAHLTEADVLGTWAGLRPLLAPMDGQPESSRSREHVVVTGSGGMVTVAGGKLSTYRVMARDAVQAAVAELRARDGRPEPPEALTDLTPLPGGESRELGTIRGQGAELGLPQATVRHLLRLYGTEAAAIFNAIREERSLSRAIHPAHPAVAAEVLHVARRELARTVDDVLVRRIHVAWETADGGAAAAAETAALLGRELGWSSDLVSRRAGEYRPPERPVGRYL